MTEIAAMAHETQLAKVGSDGSTTATTTKLQTIIFPSLDIKAPEDLYFRGQRTSDASTFAEKGLRIPKNEKCILDTYFNGFSVRPWKENTVVKDLQVRLCGSGTLRIRIGLHMLDQNVQWLAEDSIELTESGSITPIKSWPELRDGLIFLELLAKEDCHFTEGFFETTTPQQNPVNLGIVVTHFNRKHYVLPAMKRVSEQLLADPDYSNKIDLIVVDNSKNITPEEAGAAIVIPNENLGGSGGFTRGLLHLIDNNYSHCLFMDDDASCEIESIRRTYRLLQFARDSKIAVAGSMLLEEAPHILHERGAIFEDGKYRPQMKGLDLRHVGQLLISETRQTNKIYGGWWHFAFSVENITAYPFPFFVRGDDVLFSLINDFDIVTINGVACWAEDFEIKESPMVRYFSMRGTLGLMLLHSDKGRIRYLKTAWRPIRDSLLSYHYESARAYTLAIEHVMQGPQFFTENLDTSAIRREIAEFNKVEKLAVYETPKNLTSKRHKTTPLRRALQKLTLNGFLLPKILIRKKTTTERKGYFGSHPTLFRYKHALFHVQNADLGYIVEHDKRRFFSGSYRLFKALLNFSLCFNRLRKEYREALPEMTSQNFWRNVYTDKTSK